MVKYIVKCGNDEWERGRSSAHGNGQAWLAQFGASLPAGVIANGWVEML